MLVLDFFFAWILTTPFSTQNAINGQKNGKKGKGKKSEKREQSLCSDNI
jgi:hypothetical protein